MAVWLAALSLLAGLSFTDVEGQVYQASVASQAPQYIQPLSKPVAVLGINLSQNSGERLLSVSVNFTDVGSDGGFNSSDLAPLAADASSGVALFIDNKTGGTAGVFDDGDLLAPTSSTPVWSVNGPIQRTTLSFSGLDIPTDDLGNKSGPDFFVVIRTSGSAKDGNDFSISLSSGDLSTDSGDLSFQTADTGPITIDALVPRADAGPDRVTTEGVPTAFNGGASTDNIGIANYTWLFGDFGANSLDYGVYVTHTFGSPGRFIVVLNVTDYAGNSDEASVVVTVGNVNAPPAIISVPPTKALQGTTYFYLMQAVDPDGDALRYFKVDGPSAMTMNQSTGLAVWTPGPGDVGARNLTLGVTDDKSAPVRQFYIINVEDINDPPYFVSLPVQIATQSQPYSYKAEARDPENNQLKYTLAASPHHMTVGTYSGLVNWTPAWDQIGLNRVVLAVFDGQFTVYQDFVINVTNANDPPVVLSIPPANAEQGVPFTYQVQATDPDGDELRFILNPAPANMTIDSRSGHISWLPGPDQTGNISVGVGVSDLHGGLTNQSFVINVADVNDPPEIVSTPPLNVRQGSPYTYRPQAFDPEGDHVEFSLLAGPAGIWLDISDSTIHWIPGQEAVGKRNDVAILASDGLGGVGVQNYQIAVQDVNDLPVIVGGIAPVAYQGQPYFTQVRAYDPDGDELTYTLITQLPDMELDRRTGFLTWYPGRPQVGDYHLVVRITDGNSTHIDGIFNVTVMPANDPPRIQPIGILRANVGERFNYMVGALDPDGDALLFFSNSKLFKINATTGEIAFVPGEGDAGTYEFTVEVVDAGGLNDSAGGVIIVSEESSGLDPAKAVGYGLAGIGGSSPWLILIISIGMAGAILFEYYQLHRREEEDRRREEAELPSPEPPKALAGPVAEDMEKRAAPGRKATEGSRGEVAEKEQRAALEKERARELKESEELKIRELIEKEKRARVVSAGMEAEKKDSLERERRERERLEKAKDAQAAREAERLARERKEKEAEKERLARERRAKEEEERLAREEEEKEAEKERLAREGGAKEEEGTPKESMEVERRILSKEEAERLEREVEEELARAGIAEKLEDRKEAGEKGRKNAMAKKIKKRD